jgi:hypothetical protein
MRAVLLAVCLAACHKPPTSSACLNNSTLQFKRIDDRVAKYKAGDHGSGAVYWARLYLETARFVLTGKGIDGSGAACTAGDHGSADYKSLLSRLTAHEKDVAWMESERGVTFAGIVHAAITWTWAKTGQPVSQNDANTL